MRQLAVDLSVNLNTVAKAYREMEIRGIVDTQQGTGTFVSTRRAERKTSERRKALEGLVDRFVSLASSSGFSLDELAEALTERAEKWKARAKETGGSGMIPITPFARQKHEARRPRQPRRGVAAPTDGPRHGRRTRGATSTRSARRPWSLIAVVGYGARDRDRSRPRDADPR